MNHLVSVLVTVYNRERFLSACLESILASTWVGFEVVVVDDCSTDTSVEVAMQYAVRDPRIKVHRNDRNLGDYPNRMRAASLAQGKYLKYVDSDDLIYPHSLAIMVEAMEQYPEAALGLSDSVIDPRDPYPRLSDSHATIRNHFLGRSRLGSGPTGAIIRRDAFNDLGGFSGRRYLGDSELWLKLASRWPLVSLPPALVWWRCHEGQQMAAEMRDIEVLHARYAFSYEFASQTTLLSPSDRIGALDRLRRHHARRLLAIAIKGGAPVRALRLIRSGRLTPADLWLGLLGYGS
ncbi:MAG: glycosyltransferase family 2 protein [Chromatiaceae bacterium]|nr:glycosyltransferase family 2 protein [Chromatiaceae bacterium]